MMMMRGGNGNIGGNIGMMDGMLLPTNNTTTANNATIDQGLGLGPHLVGRQLIVNGKQLDIVRQLGEGGFSFVYLVRSKYNNNNSNINGSSNGNASNNDNADSSFDNAGGGGGGNKRRQRQGSPSTRSMSSSVTGGGGGGGGGGNGSHMVLKITAISNAAQQHMAEKEARLLRMLNHRVHHDVVFFG
jgi:serine/threonine protein kinase